jgi:glycosyltransferase involved in cell wall biosynthesis
MKLSIIICSYNRASYIEAAFDSLYNQSSGLDSFETIIVDNNSTDNTADVFTQWRAINPNGSFSYLTEGQQGASFARNTGAAYAKGQWLCFMDDDAVATPDYVKNIIRHIETKPEAVGFGEDCLDADGLD